MELSEDSRSLECKICKETEFSFHEIKEIYNTEDDSTEDIKNVYQCKTCGSLYFTSKGYDCVQLEMNVTANKHALNLSN